MGKQRHLKQQRKAGRMILGFLKTPTDKRDPELQAIFVKAQQVKISGPAQDYVALMRYFGAKMVEKKFGAESKMIRNDIVTNTPQTIQIDAVNTTK